MGVKYTYQAEKEMRDLGNKLSKAITSSAKGAWKVAVRSTPRKTGTAQAGWKLSNKRRGSYVPKVRVQSRPHVPNFRFRVTKDKRFYLYNNVVYIEVLEEGSLNRTPHHMMLAAKLFFEKDLRKRINRIRP